MYHLLYKKLKQIQKIKFKTKIFLLTSEKKIIKWEIYVHVSVPKGEKAQKHHMTFINKLFKCNKILIV
jgi:hypothetical protein